MKIYIAKTISSTYKYIVLKIAIFGHPQQKRTLIAQTVGP